MKIWIVQDYLRSGGTERQTVLLARAFHDAGHPTAILTFRPSGLLSNTLGPVSRHVLQTLDTGLNWFAPGLIKTIRSASPDVVLCMGRMANCHAGRIARALPSASVIGTLRTGKPLPWLFRRSLQQVAHVVANSLESANLVAQKYSIPSSRLSVIHNALVFSPDPENPSGRDTPWRSRLGADEKTLVLLCVGMLRPEKNQNALIEIVAMLGQQHPWQLWLAGEGEARTACEMTAARLGVADRVKFLGFQPDPTALYRAADIAVLASKAESLSNFLIEAQAHGLPAVAYAAGGVSECIQNGTTGQIIQPDDRDNFRAALERYMESAPLRHAAGLAARTFARRAFEPAQQARAYLELFSRLRAGHA